MCSQTVKNVGFLNVASWAQDKKNSLFWFEWDANSFNPVLHDEIFC